LSAPHRIEVVVSARRHEADGIATFELVRADGGALPPFAPGAHIDVDIGNGITRQYSLCNAPHETHRYLIGVLRDEASRGGSAGMHQLVREGSVLRIGAPNNLFPLVPAAHTVLLAGGIGVTPLLAMAEHLAACGQSFEFHYCARSPERMAFRERIAQSSYAAQVTLHLDSGALAQRLDARSLLAGAPADTRVYVCGPAGFIDHIGAAAQRAGWPAERLHVERFAAAPRMEQGAGEGDTAFSIELASSGRVLEVPPNRTVIQVLAQHGVEVPVSCEQGICGTCLTRVLSGEPDHRDSYLTEEEQAVNDIFTPCCSRAKSARLVLDL
jgi:vanillate O-demethylase ferredoxin subunit